MNSYFSHDSNARENEKIVRVRMKYGWRGYGLYFAIIELLRDKDDFMLSRDYTMMNFILQDNEDVIKDIVENYGLFEFTKDEKKFYSESLNNRMEIKENVSKKRAEAGKREADKRWNNNNTNSKNSKAMAKSMANNSTPINGKMANDSNKSKDHHQEIQEKNGEPVAPSVQKSKSHDDEDFKSLLTYYQENIGQTNPVVIQQLQESVNDFTERKTSLKESYDIVRLAIELTAKNNVHNWNYVNKILLNWQSNNLFTLSNIKANQKERGKLNSSDNDVDPWEKREKEQESKGFWG